MLRAGRAHGAEATWAEMEAAGLDAADLLWVARGLIAAGRDGGWLRDRADATTGGGTGHR